MCFGEVASRLVERLLRLPETFPCLRGGLLKLLEPIFKALHLVVQRFRTDRGTHRARERHAEAARDHRLWKIGDSPHAADDRPTYESRENPTRHVAGDGPRRFRVSVCPGHISIGHRGGHATDSMVSTDSWTVEGPPREPAYPVCRGVQLPRAVGGGWGTLSLPPPRADTPPTSCLPPV